MALRGAITAMTLIIPRLESVMVMGVMAIGRIPITVIGLIIPTVIGLTTMAAEVVTMGEDMADTTGKAEAAAIIGTAVGDMAADRAENTTAVTLGADVQGAMAAGIRGREEVSAAAINGVAAVLVRAVAFAPVRAPHSVAEAAAIILAVDAAVRGGAKA